MRKILNRYGITKIPFTKEVEPDELFMHPKSKEIQTRLKAAVKGRASGVLTGDAGTGKTFLLRTLEENLGSGRYRVTYIHNSKVNRRDFYRQLSGALGLEIKATAPALFRQIQTHVEELADCQKVHPVLILDEAHLLSLSVLEHLHILLNYRRDSRSFLSILLVGLPELREMLSRNILTSLTTRLPVRVHLKPLDVPGIDAYLRHRMDIVGCSQEIFSEEAVLCIREVTGGVMRKIDVLALTSLDVASQNNKGTLVDGPIVQKAVKVCAEVLR